MSNQNIYTHQSRNIFKTIMLMAVFLVMIIAIGYAAAWYIGSPWILYVAVAFAVGMNIFSYWRSDKLVLRMTNAREARREVFQELELIRMVENLSITAGLPMPRVYIVDDPSPNAFATGRNPEHAVVAATSGLLEILDKNELEGVMAHELAHVGNRDMLVMTVAVVLAGFVAILADFLSRSLMFGGGRDRSPIFLILGLAGIILLPIAAQLMQLAISRKREYLADATGAMLTRYPEGLASALDKISTAGRRVPMRKASHATAHLFISDPYGGQKQNLWQRLGSLFQTHPPAPERIARLRGMNL
jgi:heat shock protein HtpX